MAEFDEAIGLADRAVAAAREHGTPAVLADALITRGTAAALLGRRRRRSTLLREGVAPGPRPSRTAPSSAAPTPT